MQWDCEVIRDLLLQAAKIALLYYESPEIVLKADNTVVTQADQEIETCVSQRLTQLDPTARVLGEESAEACTSAALAALKQGRLYIIDPIDGTAPYAHHLPTWGISLGRAEDGELRDGAIYLPVTDELYMTAPDGVRYWPQATAASYQLLPRPEPACTTSLMVSISQITARRGQLDVPNPVLALSCAVVPLVAVLRGRMMAYCSRVKLWDLAGAVPMFARLGLTIRDLSGKPFSLRIDDATYNLNPQSSSCWRQRHVCIFGVPGAFNYLHPYLKPGESSD